jgi:hypothetical protein
VACDWNEAAGKAMVAMPTVSTSMMAFKNSVVLYIFHALSVAHAVHTPSGFSKKWKTAGSIE